MHMFYHIIHIKVTLCVDDTKERHPLILNLLYSTCLITQPNKNSNYALLLYGHQKNIIGVIIPQKNDSLRVETVVPSVAKCGS